MSVYMVCAYTDFVFIILSGIGLFHQLNDVELLEKLQLPLLLQIL